MSGYVQCVCRDCFEIAISGDVDGGETALCNACEEAGCDETGESECESPDAYGGECVHTLGTCEVCEPNPD